MQMEDQNAWSGSLSRRQRGIIAFTAIMFHVFALLALFTLHGGRAQSVRDKTLALLDLAPPPQTVLRPRPAVKHRNRAGAASAPNLKQIPVEIVAPPPILPPIRVPVVAAPISAHGNAANAGAAPVAGPGTGAGGQGQGRGSGGAGNGDGDGAGPVQIKGKIRNSDYPAAPDGTPLEGSVSVRYLVRVDGRVADCRITHSSGSSVLDQTTCRLITERFRFRPARDGIGHPVSSYLEEDHDWIIQRDPSTAPLNN